MSSSLKLRTSSDEAGLRLAKSEDEVRKNREFSLDQARLSQINPFACNSITRSCVVLFPVFFSMFCLCLLIV